VAVGADPQRIAILDNFCWGYTDRAETLGSLVRAALACHDVAIAYGTPFISGKDSLNNEFSYEHDGEKVTISIPATLLISALGQVTDVANCVTMDLKRAGSHIYIVGRTRDELGGSHVALVHGLSGGHVPQVDTGRARELFTALHRAIQNKTVLACHDLSEGGLAVALAEMAFAGGWGARVDLTAVPTDITPGDKQALWLMFSESNSRFLCEVSVENAAKFERHLADVEFARIGEVTVGGRVVISLGESRLVDAGIEQLKQAWQAPLRWK
jgi:phosphoribosylformylglycinamidine synthase